MKTQNKKGIALLSALLFTVILYALSGIFLLRVVNENRMAQVEKESTKSFYAAQGGAQLALNQLEILINDFLQDTISNAEPSGVISFATSMVASGDGIGWLVYAVREDNVPVLVQSGEQAEYEESGTVNNLDYTYKIVFTENSEPINVSEDVWNFPYNFKIQATATDGNISSDVFTAGDFTVTVTRDNFAKFALFTNSQTTPSGSNVWFTDKTNFAGPVHTNDRFNFALNPSGTFEQEVTQYQQTARFYNGGFNVLIDGDSNGTTDVPIFNNTFERDVEQVAFSSSSQEQDMIDQALGGQSISTDGIYVPNSGGSLSGGIYIKGNGTISMNVDGSNNAVYTVTQGANTNIITVDKTGNQTNVWSSSTGSTQTYSGFPNGVDKVGTIIYVDGNLTSLDGTVQSDTKLTIGTKGSISITNNVKYQSYTPAVGTPGSVGYVPPSAIGAANLLGLVSWGGDVIIAPSAPNGVEIHGTVLAQNGIFTVEGYNTISPKGTATLLGGSITDNYGAFGTFNGATGTQVSGYGRNFVYDERMKNGESPPYFPTLNTFIGFSNDITDKLVWQQGE